MGIAAKRCGGCRFFSGTPAALERAVPGLNTLSSAYGSVRANTGLCERHDAFLTSFAPPCADYAARTPEENSLPSKNRFA